LKIVHHIPTSLVEWKGRLSSVVFVGGCNLRCPFCYNPEIVLDFETLEKVYPENVINNILEANAFPGEGITGLVISGGEPLLFKRELFDFIQIVKATIPDIEVRLDTNFVIELPDYLLTVVDRFAPSWKLGNGILSSAQRKTFERNCEKAKEKIDEIRIVITGDDDVSQIIRAINNFRVLLPTHIFKIIRMQGRDFLGNPSPVTSQDFEETVNKIKNNCKGNYIIQE